MPQYADRAGFLRSIMLACTLALLAVLSGCTLPALDGRTVSSALSPEETRGTALGQAAARLVPARSSHSGIHPLADARHAFAARVLLTRNAERTLDVQYYIWRKDITGVLLLHEMQKAANRGVRVRLLLDDHGTAAVDAELAALNAHPQVEVRLFNPFSVRRPKYIGFLTDFSRLNRRMHNKSFTADNQFTIVGGRNVGDEYFGAADGLIFADLDVLAIGPVVDETSRDFDRYWASASAYPAELILPDPAPDALDQLQAAGAVAASADAATEYLLAVRRSGFMRALSSGELPFESAVARMVSDDPAKALAKADRRGHLMPQLMAILGQPRRSVDLVSPYFVPTTAGVEAFAALVREGIRVRVLTNSLQATDVAVVHAGYAKRRKALLQAGVSLFELRELPQEAGRDERDRAVGPFGSSGSSLHAKTFAIDGERVFVGSFNFDPRSINLNTELGFVIESRMLAREVATAFETSIPAYAYEVRLSDSGRLYWLERTPEGVLRHDFEPGTDPLQRFGIRLLSILPIEWLL
ncbi:MAG: phospholipase D family protein [Zoogloeaceae bacterium]|nr:phospholipase D family protein [Zoogloeaceae bacterium]